ncbi:MAG TPA: transglycosylase SLT domain-containing protein [Phototrophicaceae bacterium]|nr:transglycosylase SLT domain-containing protein [Phototrophicaceae bacterium]
MKLRSVIFFATAVALNGLVASTAMADVYAFKDKNGVVTFTNVPNHAGFRRVFRDAGPPASSNGVVDSDYDGYIQNASGRYNIDPDLIRAVIKAESDFKVSARSNKGAMGLMQLMPDTARLHNVNDAYNPGENVEGGARHLRMLLDRYQGDLELSLAAYNAGSAAVEKHRGIPPFPETKEYVRRVLRFYDSYRNALPSFQPVAQQ